MSENTKITPTGFITDVLNRAKANPNTAELHDCVNRLAQEIKYYTSIELASVTEKRAKFILNRINFFSKTAEEIIALLRYAQSLEDAIEKMDDCIHELYADEQNLHIQNQLLRQHLEQAVDGYLLITANKKTDELH